MYGFSNAQVRAAAAEVAGHGGIDVAVGGVGLLGEERRGGHDLAGLAVAALGDADFRPGELDRMGSVRGAEAFDGGDLLADAGGDGSYTGADGFTVEVDGAGAALGDAAGVLGAGQRYVFAKEPQQRQLFGNVETALDPIDVDYDIHRGNVNAKR